MGVTVEHASSCHVTPYLMRQCRLQNMLCQIFAAPHCSRNRSEDLFEIGGAHSRTPVPPPPPPKNRPHPPPPPRKDISLKRQNVVSTAVQHPGSVQALAGKVSSGCHRSASDHRFTVITGSFSKQYPILSLMVPPARIPLVFSKCR